MVGPEPSSEAVSNRMARQARSGTSPELALRRELHRRGMRFRVDVPLEVVSMRRRRVDLAFTRQRVAVFVDGCFWHSCPQHATSPKANGGWWAVKLAGNVDRDRDTDDRLVAVGWTVLRVWEHEDMVDAADRVERLVRPDSREG